MVLVGDHDEHVILPLAQDHKRLGEGDTGPNTGGMGAYAPVPTLIINAEQRQQIANIAAASLDGMRAESTPYERAILYIGLMMAEELDGSPVVIEYNCRFGDPETQVLTPLLTTAGVDVYRLLRSAAEGDLEVPAIDFADLSLAALTVCLASQGYPTNKQIGEPIWGLDGQYDNVTIQRAAVKNNSTAGGRVLYVTGTGETIDEAADRAYGAIDVEHKGPQSGKIGFANMQFRRDIGYQARKA
jgi:phosphoribosylamine-glycine ligase